MLSISLALHIHATVIFAICVLYYVFSGIGAACAIELALRGASALCLADRDEDGLAKVIDTLYDTHDYHHVLPLVVDITSEQSVIDAIARSVAKFGKVDIAIHAAGQGDVHKPTHEVAIGDWRRIIDVNQTGTWLCEREVLRQMMKQR
jgi:NADP-dependent 3-hydroxy acid dehydrogenase YdfG